jgi:predicted O-methyltransferase YrrM
MVPPTELCKLAIKYGSDRTPFTGGHAYTPFYDRIFKGRHVKKLVEIGIDTGRGLRMWAEYFPEAEIYGLDVQTNLLINEGRIKSLYCDLSSVVSIQTAAEQVGDSCDLIFDDGSHDPQHQIQAAEILMPFLSPSGLYIIEDVGHPEIVVPRLKIQYLCEVREFKVNKLSLDDDRLVLLGKTRGVV